MKIELTMKGGEVIQVHVTVEMGSSVAMMIDGRMVAMVAAEVEADHALQYADLTGKVQLTREEQIGIGAVHGNGSAVGIGNEVETAIVDRQVIGKRHESVEMEAQAHRTPLKSDRPKK